MTRPRLRLTAAAAGAALALYALIGFFVLPWIARDRLVAYAGERLHHHLEIGTVRFNPFTAVLELSEVDLRDRTGIRLVAWRRLLLDLSARGLWQRAWTIDRLRIEAPVIYGELRPDGRHNFSALLEALRDPQPDTRRPPARLTLGRAEIEDGRVELADLPAGPHARMVLAPVRFELHELTTLSAGEARYSLSARTAGGARMEWSGFLSAAPAAAHGRIALQGLQMSGLKPWLAARLQLAGIEGQADFTAAYRVSLASEAVAMTVSEAALEVSGLALRAPGAREPFTRVEGLHLRGGTFDLAARTVSLETLEIAGAKIGLRREADGSVNWPLPAATRAAAPGPVRKGGTVLPRPSDAPGDVAEAVSPRQEAPWRMTLRRLLVSDAALAYADARSEPTARLALDGVRLELAASTVWDGSLRTELTQPQAAIASTRGELAGQRLRADELAMHASFVGLGMHAGGLRVELSGPAARSGRFLFERQAQQWQVEKLFAGAARMQLAADLQPPATLDAGEFTLELAGIAARMNGSDRPALSADTLRARAGNLVLRSSETMPELSISELSVALRALLLSEPDSAAELGRAALIELGGMQVSTAQRHIAAERVLFAGTHAVSYIERDGKSNWERFFAALLAGDEPASAPPVKGGENWSFSLRSVEFHDAGGSYTDRRQEPPLAIGVADVHARAQGVRSDRASPLRLQLQGRLAGGGSFRAAGSVRLQPVASDLEVALADIPLSMAQPFIAPHVRLQLVSGLASAKGRLRAGAVEETGAAALFEGDLRVRQLVIEETEPARPFLSLDALDAHQAVLALGPNRVDVADLRLEKLATRLIIGEDQRVNLAKLRRGAAPGTVAAVVAVQTKEERAAAPPRDDPPSDAFPISVARVRLRDSVLEFADLSLRPQFQTRMHELQGVVTGLSSSAAARTRLELEARVDEYGSAQIRGTLNPFRPERFTDVTLAFRNLEMTALTPYTAKFAGYRIASGKLSLDLHYRIKNAALAGDNKIVVDELQLGERVQSPTALELPLELAIAILKDENGRIDIGLPVAGSLADPQFDIGAIVWKALGSLLGRVVTAPFRALASLFGGDASDQLDAIEFAAGDARLAPPERQKLETVARALDKRPELKLTIVPVYAERADREALQSLSLRRAVLARTGIALDPDEAPGPLDYGNARVRAAIEALFLERFGEPVLRDLAASLRRTRPAELHDAATEGGAPQGKPQGEGGRATTGSSRLARTMTQRLIATQPLEPEALHALALARAARVAEQLQAGGKLAPGRVARSEPRALAQEEREDSRIALQLQVGVAR